MHRGTEVQSIERLEFLLGERTGNAQLNSRYPPPDTPSIYSSFSPSETHSLRPSFTTSPSPSTQTSTDRNRLNDLAVSMLDFDDEPSSSDSINRPTSPDFYEDQDDEDDVSMPRMSLLGPKMRFHSKAPWELDATLEEDDESESNSDSPRMVALKRSFDTASSYAQSYGIFYDPWLILNVNPSSAASIISARKPFSRTLDSPHLSQTSAYYPGSQTPSVVISPDDADGALHPYSNPDFALSVDLSSRSASVATLTKNQPAITASPSASFQGREISSPVLQPTGSAATGFGTMAGWNAPAPSFNLISLEEARSQRARSASTANTPPTRLSSSSATTFPYSDDNGSVAPPRGHSPTNSVASKARVRSVSAGARAKQVIYNTIGPPRPERHDSDPVIPTQSSPKVIKQKKSSGFMRLFNAGRGTPPPLPSLSDDYTTFNANQIYPNPPRIMTTTTTNVQYHPPVPTLPSHPLPRSDVNSPDTAKPSPKRTPPPLNLAASNPNLFIPRGPASSVGDMFPPSRPTDESIPQSAPPAMSEFPALRLRPVSTMFSSHFSDHILVSNDSSHDADSDTLSSRSPTTLVSPISPSREPAHLSALNLQSSSLISPGLHSAVDDQSAVIQALQEQIMSAKKAWQRHIWELEGQVRDLKAEVEDMRVAAKKPVHCPSCRKEFHPSSTTLPSTSTTTTAQRHGVLNRPRARTGTGTSSRFGNSS